MPRTHARPHRPPKLDLRPSILGSKLPVAYRSQQEMTLNGVVSTLPSVKVVSISWLPSESDPGARNAPGAGERPPAAPTGARRSIELALSSKHGPVLRVRIEACQGGSVGWRRCRFKADC
jgi:hypothetical protein